MKVAFIVLMVFLLIVLNIAVLPGFSSAYYEVYRNVDGYNIANPVHDFSVPIRKAGNFFVSIGEFFSDLYELFHPVQSPVGFRIQYIYFMSDDPDVVGPSRASIIYYWFSDVDDESHLQWGQYCRIYAFTGPKEYYDWFSNHNTMVYLGNTAVYGHSYMASTMVDGRLVGVWESSLMPTPTHYVFEETFTNVTSFSDFYDVDVNTIWDDGLDWQLVE